MEIYVNISFVSIFLFFSGFKDDLIRWVYFTRIAALNTASDDVTKLGHIEYLIQTYYILVLFFIRN